MNLPHTRWRCYWVHGRRLCLWRWHSCQRRICSGCGWLWAISFSGFLSPSCWWGGRNGHFHERRRGCWWHPCRLDRCWKRGLGCGRVRTYHSLPLLCLCYLSVGCLHTTDTWALALSGIMINLRYWLLALELPQLFFQCHFGFLQSLVMFMHGFWWYRHIVS